jgi:hypothetical protein
MLELGSSFYSIENRVCEPVSCLGALSSEDGLQRTSVRSTCENAIVTLLGDKSISVCTDSSLASRTIDFMSYR